MLFAQPGNLQLWFVLVLVLGASAVLGVLALAVFAMVFGPWLRAYTSNAPISALELIGMRLRRTDVNTVLNAMIMARQSGVVVTCREMEQAYLQRVDLDKLVLVMIEAKKQDKEISFQEFVEYELQGRLAEKLKE